MLLDDSLIRGWNYTVKSKADLFDQNHPHQLIATNIVDIESPALEPPSVIKKHFPNSFYLRDTPLASTGWAMGMFKGAMVVRWHVMCQRINLECSE